MSEKMKPCDCEICRMTVEEAAIIHIEADKNDLDHYDNIFIKGAVFGANYQSTKDAKEIVELREEVEKMLEVFKWLMGYYDFPEPPKDGRPRYYWRSHLHAKLKEIGIDIHGCQSPFQPRETDNQS